MKAAVLCLTRPGYDLALKLKNQLLLRGGFSHIDVFTMPKPYVDQKKVILFDDLSALMEQLFQGYRQIICVMALGIVVRTIAPYLRDKTMDPAVVALDEAGQHVISVLSGHLGGANQLTQKIAAVIGARPVITTATDVHGLPAIDNLARELNLALDPPRAVRHVNSGIVHGHQINIYSPFPLPIRPGANISLFSLEQYLSVQAPAFYHVVVTNRLYDHIHRHTMFLRPRNLVAGIGCRSGISAEHIIKALQAAFRQSGLSPLSLRAMATIDIKAHEQGLCRAAATLGVPLISYSARQINNFMDKTNAKMHKSDFVQQHGGVPGVCEPTALLATRKGVLIFPKQKYQGVTVAIAEDR